jgi:hypothetical protein
VAQQPRKATDAVVRTFWNARSMAAAHGGGSATSAQGGAAVQQCAACEFGKRMRLLAQNLTSGAASTAQLTRIRLRQETAAGLACLPQAAGRWTSRPWLPAEIDCILENCNRKRGQCVGQAVLSKEDRFRSLTSRPVPTGGEWRKMQ